MLAAFEKAYPKATLTRAMQEKKAGRVTFELESLAGTIGRGLQYRAEGTVLEIDEALANLISNALKPRRQGGKSGWPSKSRMGSRT